MWKRRKVRMTNNMRERKKGRLGKGEKSPPPTFSTFLLISSHHFPPAFVSSSSAIYLPPPLLPLWFVFQKPTKLPRPPAASVCLYINNFWWQTAAFSSLTCQPEAWHTHFLISLHFRISLPFPLWSERSRRQVDVRLSFSVVCRDKYSSSSSSSSQKNIRQRIIKNEINKKIPGLLRGKLKQ